MTAEVSTETGNCSSHCPPKKETKGTQTEGYKMRDYIMMAVVVLAIIAMGYGLGYSNPLNFRRKASGRDVIADYGDLGGGDLMGGL